MMEESVAPFNRKLGTDALEERDIITINTNVANRITNRVPNWVALFIASFSFM
jgi:hypothetical protein